MMRAALVFVALALGGCAVDCANRDWQSRGYADGFGGHPPQDLRLARECGRLGVAVSSPDYLKGWRDGYDEWYRMIGSIDMN
jgi:Protein of unknown function (DUF2799)